MTRNASETSLQDLLDGSPLDVRYWGCFALISASGLIDFFDFFVIGFIMSRVAPEWHLTYGETATILLAAGVGAITGSFLAGSLCDRYGRKPVYVVGGLICAASAGGIAFTPEGAWEWFAVLRFITGVSLTLVTSAQITMIVERTPTRARTVVAPLSQVGPSAGILASSLLSATLLPTLGWRGLAMFGFLAAVPAVLGWIFMGESIPWLLSSGQQAAALRQVAKRLRRPVSELPLPPKAYRTVKPSGNWVEMLSEGRRCTLIILTWAGVATALYGVYLWGPTILSLTLAITPGQAAGLFIYVSCMSLVGKALFSVLPYWLGRRGAGLLSTGCGVLAVLAAAFAPAGTLLGLPWRLLAFMSGAIFIDGGLANMVPYGAEVFPVRMAARGVGLCQAANGVGKIVGPLSLAFIAGTGNLVAPTATLAAVVPGFCFLAGCVAVAFLAFLLIPIETSGRGLVLTDLDEASTAATQSLSPLAASRNA